MQLQDVAVLITGGGSGLGAATGRAMAAKGAKIGVLDQSKENAEKVAAEVKGVALHADVTDEIQHRLALVAAPQGLVELPGVTEQAGRAEHQPGHRRRRQRGPRQHGVHLLTCEPGLTADPA